MDDDDALEELADEITTLAAHIHAATQRLLELIAEFDRRGGWKAGGHRSCAHWLAYRTGIDLGTAREKVRTARVLVGLPETSASMARGELSFSAVRALTRVATPETEADLLELARGCTTAQLERVVRSWRTGTRATEAERERERHERRSFSVFPEEDGMYLLRGRVPAEVGALLRCAIDAASDALYRESRRRGGSAEPPLSSSSTPDDTRAEAARRRADALALVAERALSAGFGGRAAGSGDEEAGYADDTGGAMVHDSGRGTPLPISGTRAERHQIMVHVSPETLSAVRSYGLDAVADGSRETHSGDAEPDRSDHPDQGADASRETHSGDAEPDRSSHPDEGAGASAEARSVDLEPSRDLHPDAAAHGSRETCSTDPGPCRSHLDDGTRLAPDTSRRLACDAGRVTVTRGGEGSVLNVGRRTRTVSPAVRRALEVRDRGCRFPGCGMRFTDAHHVRHWADGGETSLGNCLLLCRHHHRLVHEGGWTIEWWGDGRPAFVDPRGQAHFEGRWSPPELGEHPVETLVAANRARGADPDWRTAGARWKREADIPAAVYLRALEATG